MSEHEMTVTMVRWQPTEWVDPYIAVHSVPGEATFHSGVFGKFKMPLVVSKEMNDHFLNGGAFAVSVRIA